MSPVTITLLVITVVLIIGIVVLYFLGKRAQKKQDEQQAQIEAMKQRVSMLIIDKKRMKIKDSGLPQAVIQQTPRLLRGSKLPIVKAKVGPQIMTLVSDEKIYDMIPTKKEVITILRAVHKYKDSREQFEQRTHKRLIDIITPTQKTVDALSRLEMPAGVYIDIKMKNK